MGLEFLQTEQGLFMRQRKYVCEVLKKFDTWNCNPLETPAVLNVKLDKCLDEPTVDGTMYRRILGSLRFIIATLSLKYHLVLV